MYSFMLHERFDHLVGELSSIVILDDFRRTDETEHLS
jgi:hypothetical protein